MARIPFLEPTIDLSHYDLIDQFTAREAACLIAGIDPNMQDVTELYGSPEFARMRAIEDAIEQACNRANETFVFAITSPSARGQINPPWYDVFDSVGDLVPMLPCIRLWAEYHKRLGSIDQNFLGLILDYTREKFRRQDITTWLQAKGYKQARYFLPSEAMSVSDPAEVERLRAQIAQLEAELDDAYNLAKANEADFERHLAYCSESSAIQNTKMEASSSGLSFRYETDLLKEVAKVQDRYLGENYDPDDLDTRPRKDTVIDWLKDQNPGMSNASAEAIDRVAMPFSRGK